MVPSLRYSVNQIGDEDRRRHSAAANSHRLRILYSIREVVGSFICYPSLRDSTVLKWYGAIGAVVPDCKGMYSGVPSAVRT